MKQVEQITEHATVTSYTCDVCRIRCSVLSDCDGCGGQFCHSHLQEISDIFALCPEVDSVQICLTCKPPSKMLADKAQAIRTAALETLDALWEAWQADCKKP